MPAALLRLTPGTGAAPAAPGTPATPTTPATPATPVPVDVNAQIQAVFQARQLILQKLIALEDQRKDLGRTAALAYSSDVAANGVDPAKAVAARDAWQTQNALVTAQEGALKDLLGLIEARIEEFKRSNKPEVSAVLRDQIAALSENLSQQEKTEHLTEHQLKVLWNELRDVDPGCLAAMAKESSPRSQGAKKAAKETGKK
jgi:uncharacterized coiled-coil protein SlyX